LKKITTLLFVGIIVFCSFQAFPAPGLINYQGRLTDDTGNPITISVGVTFTFWDSNINGNQLGDGFSDVDIVFPDSNGIYSTMIGDDPGNLIPASIFSGDNVWLNVNIGGEDLTPRKQMTSVGYALQAKASSDVKKVVRDFPVASGETVNSGDVVSLLFGEVMKFGRYVSGTESVFNEANTFNPSIMALSESKFIVAYKDVGNSNYGTAIVGTISAGTISWGEEEVFSNNETLWNSTAKIATDKFVVAFRDHVTGHGIARVGAVSGSTITWGDAAPFNENETYSLSVLSLSETVIIVVYTDGGDSNKGKIARGVVSGTTISWDALPTMFSSSSVSAISGASLSSDSFVFAFSESRSISEKYSRVALGIVSGFNVSFFPYTFYDRDMTESAAVGLSQKQFVIAFRSSGSNGALAGSIYGKSVILGQNYIFNPGNISSISAAPLTDARFVIVYTDDGNSEYITAVKGEVSRNEILWDPAFVMKNATCDIQSTARLSGSKFIIAFEDQGNSNYGAVLIGETSGKLLGIADADASTGENVPIILNGVSPHHSGLSLDKTYYAGSEGALTENIMMNRVGIAVSGTELLLDPRRP